MRTATIFAFSALVLGFVHSHALAQSSPPPTPRPNQSELEEVRNTYIFKFNSRVPQAAMAGIAHRVVGEAGGTVHHVYTNVLGGFAATLPGAAVWGVAGEPEIVSYERDQIVTIFAPPWCKDNPDDPRCGGDDGGGGGGGSGTIATCDGNYSDPVPWGVQRINAPGAHKGNPTTNPNCGQGIHVYVLDTGIDLDHPDLTPLDGVDCRQSGCPSGGDDKNGHGTHVAGTIAARINGSQVVGVAPAVYLHAVQVLGPSGSGSYSDVIAGIDHVAYQAEVVVKKPVVANMSLGGSGSKGSGKCTALKFDGSSSFHKAICDAARAGVVFVVAAGNSDADAEGFIPAAYDDAVITVSATNSSDDWPYWSNWGNGSTSWTHISAPVAIAAPGVSILSTEKGGGTSTKSGTSMASPHVAGVAALLLERGIYSRDYTAFTNIRQAILDTAESTTGFSNNSENPHAEDFACAPGC